MFVSQQLLSVWREALFLIRCKPAVVVKAKG
jgi:hypothetical protein